MFPAHAPQGGRGLNDSPASRDSLALFGALAFGIGTSEVVVSGPKPVCS
jgi:hypothetical protein